LTPNDYQAFLEMKKHKTNNVKNVGKYQDSDFFLGVGLE